MSHLNGGLNVFKLSVTVAGLLALAGAWRGYCLAREICEILSEPDAEGQNMGMGHIATNDPMHTCDNCEGTYTGTWSEVAKLGWKKHQDGKMIFIMCGDCEAEFAERRKAAEAA